MTAVRGVMLVFAAASLVAAGALVGTSPADSAVPASVKIAKLNQQVRTLKLRVGRLQAQLGALRGAYNEATTKVAVAQNEAADAREDALAVIGQLNANDLFTKLMPLLRDRLNAGWVGVDVSVFESGSYISYSFRCSGDGCKP